MNKSYRLLILFFLFIGLFDLNNANAQSNFWEQTKGPYGGNIHVLAINRASILFAGMEDIGLFQSQLNKDNWSDISSDLGNLQLKSLFFPTSDEILAGTNDGLFRSTNLGKNWSKIDLAGRSERVFTIGSNSQGHLFIGSDRGGVIRSTNNGKTWWEINNGLNNTSVYSLVINKIGHLIIGTNGGGVYTNQSIK